MLKTLLSKPNVYWSVTTVIATLIGLAFRSHGLRQFALNVLHIYFDAGLLAFGIFLVSMLSGWLIFPLMIGGIHRSGENRSELENDNPGDVYVLIYTVIAAVLVFEDVLGR